MRLWHMLLITFLCAVGLTVVRDLVGRVMIVTLLTSSVELFFGTIAMMILFRTVAAIGQAEEPIAYAEAVAATALVLMLASIVMVGMLWFGFLLMSVAVA